MEAKPKTNNHTMQADQVAALVDAAEQATAQRIKASAADVWKTFEAYARECKDEDPPKVPTFTGFSHRLGFAS
jgi:hypothetical protein